MALSLLKRLTKGSPLTATEHDSNMTAIETSVNSKQDIIGAMAIGNINSPLLDMPLKNSLAMKAGVGSATFTRASTATYIDRYGVLKSAAIDEPRFEKEGYLNEGSSTNLLTYSEQFDNAIWSKTALTVTANTTATTDPYGTNLAEKYVSSGVGGRIAQNSQAFALESYITVSVFAKKEATSNYLRFEIINAKGALFNLLDGTISNITSGCTATMIPLSNGWYRCSLSFLSTGITTALCAFYPTSTTGASSVANDSMYIFGAQLEALPFASSYIPTVASTVTRSADVLNVSYSGNMPAVLNNSTISIDFQAIGTRNTYGGNQDAYLWRIVGETYRMFRYMHNSQTSPSPTLVYGGDLISPAQVHDNVNHRYICTYSTAPIRTIYKDGVMLVSTSSALSNITGSATYICIGGFDNSSHKSYGHISNFRIYDKTLTTQEVALA